MNVFVLCTGRCGSMTFSRACSHLDNFTSGHETRTSLIGDERLDFPDGHIEIDNHLAWHLGRLDARYGSAAFYVHLSRDPKKTAASFQRLINSPVSPVRAYHAGALMRPQVTADELFDICLDYVNNLNADIAHFLKDKPRTMAVDIDDAGAVFPRFCQQIGAIGDIAAGANEFNVRYNLKLPSLTSGDCHPGCGVPTRPSCALSARLRQVFGDHDGRRRDIAPSPSPALVIERQGCCSVRARHGVALVASAPRLFDKVHARHS